jgi:hypothetical protein
MINISILRGELMSICNCIQYIDDIELFVQRIQALLKEEEHATILVAGNFDNLAYKQLLDKLLISRHIKNCKIVIPYVTNSGIISRSYINRIFNNGGEIRINSKFRNNLIVIGRHAFILSFSCKYNKEYGTKTYFECCVETNAPEAVDKIKSTLLSLWIESLPIVYE